MNRRSQVEFALLVAAAVPHNGSRTWQEVAQRAMQTGAMDGATFLVAARTLVAAGRLRQVGNGRDATVELVTRKGPSYDA